MERQLTPESTVLAFFSLEGVGGALRRNQWSIDEEIRILREIAISDEEPDVRMRAVDRLRKAATVAAVSEGVIATTTKQVVLQVPHSDGTATLTMTERVRMLAAGALRASELALDGRTLPEPAPEHKHERPQPFEGDTLDAECDDADAVSSEEHEDDPTEGSPGSEP